MGALLKLYGFGILFSPILSKSSSGFKVFLIWKSLMASGSTLQRAAAFSKTVFPAAGEIDLVLRRICWSLVGSRFRLRPIYFFLKGK